MARRLKQVRDQHGPESIGVIGSNHTTNEENYLLNRFARVTLGTNNIDHHRTADYVGLASLLGPNAKDSLATMADVYNAQTVLLIGNDVTQQNPLVAWQIRTGVRHHGTRLYVVNGRDSTIHRKAAFLARVPDGQEAAAVKWLAVVEGNFDAPTTEALTELKAEVEKESDVVVIFGAEIQGAASARPDFVRFAPRRQDEVHGAGRLFEFTRRCRYGRICLTDLPGYAPLSDGFERERLRQALGRTKFPISPGSLRRK